MDGEPRIGTQLQQQSASSSSRSAAATPSSSASSDLVTVFDGISVPGRALYYFVAFLWGSFSPAVRELYTLRHPPPPAVFNTARLLLSCATFWPVWLQQWRQLRERLQARVDDGASSLPPPRQLYQRLTELFWSETYHWFRGGLELGLYVFLGNVAQVIGLEYTPASRAAFLVQLQTVFIPLLSGFFAQVGFIEAGSSQLNGQTLITSGMAFLGVFLLSQDKTSTAPSNWFGDTLEVVAAFAFSIYVLRLDRYARALTDTTPLAATKILVQAVCSLGWAAFSSHPNGHVGTTSDSAALGWYDALVTVGVVAWTGLLVSAFSAFVQPQCQKRVPAGETGVILATQPLFAAALSVMFLGERLGWKGALGGCIILLSTVVSSFLNGLNHRRDTLNKHKTGTRH
jgi:drug/metabolite transporter (DMT)-like permease